jgi:hypothetical protein
MGDHNIDMDILDIDMGYLFTLPYRRAEGGGRVEVVAEAVRRSEAAQAEFDSKC